MGKVKTITKKQLLEVIHNNTNGCGDFNFLICWMCVALSQSAAYCDEHGLPETARSERQLFDDLSNLLTSVGYYK